MKAIGRSVLAGACVLGAIASLASGQANVVVTGEPVRNPAPGLLTLPDPDSPEMQAYRADQKSRYEAGKEMRRLRAKYFKNMRNTEIRQIGIDKLRAYTDPVLYPELLEVFGNEKEDVQRALMEHLADQETERADSTIAWAAVFEKNEQLREIASEVLTERVQAQGEAPELVQTVLAVGLRRENDQEAIRAGVLAGNLNIIELIPLMIDAQVVQQGSGVQGGGALGQIWITQQVAFVSDLQPVVADSAVGFDPEISVVSEGVVMRVMDAAVWGYRTEIHRSLVDMTTRRYGQSTKHLGYDEYAWADWYKNEFLPQEELKAAKQQSGN